MTAAQVQGNGFAQSSRVYIPDTLSTCRGVSGEVPPEALNQPQQEQFQNKGFLSEQHRRYILLHSRIAVGEGKAIPGNTHVQHRVSVPPNTDLTLDTQRGQ